MMRCVLFAVLATLAAGGALADGNKSNLPVVELFTSQGCSSCPPADAFLGELARREDVIALSYHVDYWDYLGWTDTLASPHNTARQRAYAAHMGKGRVYTPQMVVNGTHETVGSSRRRVYEALEQVRASGEPHLPIAHRMQDDKLIIEIGAGEGGEATIWLVRYDSTRKVAIERGENSGRSITYQNAVRDFWTLGTWRGEALEIAVSLNELERDAPDGCVVLVQRQEHGTIIGAAQMEMPPAGS